MRLTARAATLTNFAQICQECGLAPRALLAEVGLSERCLSDPDMAISTRHSIELLELAAERSHEPAFGLRMAASRRLSNLGPLGLLLRDQPTLRHAIEALVAHIHLHNPSLTLSLIEGDGLISLREETLFEGNVPTRQASEVAIAMSFRILKLFLGERWQPQRVCFRHAQPEDTYWHKKVFGHSVRFSQSFNEIVCVARDLDAPNPAADPVMAKYSQRLLQMSAGANESMSDKVRKMVVFLLPRGHCHADLVAEQLGVTRRTIHNHLTREGTSFKSLVDDMRQDLLRRYLDDKQRALSEIATLLGFSELSAFSRWHKNQFRITATQRRLQCVYANSPLRRVASETEKQ